MSSGPGSPWMPTSVPQVGRPQVSFKTEGDMERQILGRRDRGKNGGGGEVPSVSQHHEAELGLCRPRAAPSLPPLPTQLAAGGP